MKTIYLIDTQNLFYGAKVYSEFSRLNYKRFIPYLRETYGDGNFFAFVLITDYCNNTNFISMLKHLGCYVKKYYADLRTIMEQKNKIKIDWSEWLLTEALKLVQGYDKVVIVSGSGVFIRLLKALKSSTDNIVITFEHTTHKRLKDYCYTIEYIPEEFVIDIISKKTNLPEKGEDNEAQQS